MNFRKLSYILISIAIFSTVSCKNNPSESKPAEIPTLTTTTITNISGNSAISGGTISSDGGAAITARGVCWSTNQNPTINDNKTNEGTGTGIFTSNISNLTAGTTYYVKAYATNSEGTGYGNLLSFVTSAKDSSLKGAYLGQTLPGKTPQVFAPGFVSVANTKEWSCTFSADGQEFYFYRIASDGYCKIYYTKVVNGIWTEPKEFELSQGYTASTPCITLDNKYLYFDWNDENKPGKTSGYYFCERTASGWSAPKFAGQGMYLSSSLSGNLYTTDVSALFSSGLTYLAKVVPVNGVFTTFTRLNIKTGLGSQAHPCIAPDESFILFDTEGGQHLFVSFKNSDGTWNNAIDLVTKGFDRNAGGASISPDGKYLFFQLNGDIYWVDIKVVTDLK